MRLFLILTFLFNLLSTITFASSVNDTTSRQLRTKYLCKVATKDFQKPYLNEMDAFRIDKANFGYVDLYGDGSIELIAGFSDEAFRSDNWLFKDGNKQRSTGYSEYMLFSPQSSTKKPKDFNFWMARNIIPSDLNGDNIDDVVFIQHGQDFKPWKPQPNIVLLSEKNTYKKIILPGPKSLFHGGATGDIDNDGDIDIVATPGAKNSISAYINDGSGGFIFNQLINPKKGPFGKNERIANVQAWDIDADGFLDLLVDGHSPLARIYWGNGKGEFGKNFTLIKKLNNHFMQDAVFGDFDNDGENEMIILSSLGPDAYYSGWNVSLIELDKREIKSVSKVYEEVSDASDWNWFPYISACDLKNDNDLDLIIEIHGQTGEWYTQNLDKIIFENISGDFTRHYIVSPIYKPSNFYELQKINDLAKKLGISLKKYENPKTYFPISDWIKSNKKHHINKNGIFQVWVD